MARSSEVRCLVPVGTNGEKVVVNGEDVGRIQTFMRQTGCRFESEAQIKEFLNLRWSGPAKLEDFRSRFVKEAALVSATI